MSEVSLWTNVIPSGDYSEDIWTKIAQRFNRCMFGHPTSTTMADSSPSAFSVWLSQLSDTIKDSFLSLGPKPTSEPMSEAVEVNESQVDVSSMSSEEKLHVLHTQLASRGLIEPLPDRLTPINEEMEDVESRRSVTSSRPPSAGEKSVS